MAWNKPRAVRRSKSVLSGKNRFEPSAPQRTTAEATKLLNDIADKAWKPKRIPPLAAHMRVPGDD